jgi:hypothetical protein
MAGRCMINSFAGECIRKHLLVFAFAWQSKSERNSIEADASFIALRGQR